MIRDIHQLKQNQLATKADIIDEYTATIVEVNGSIWNDETKRLNWTQRTDGTGQPTPAYNKSVKAKVSMVVQIQVITGSEYPVIVDIPPELFATLQSALLPDHHTDHEPGGEDMLWSYAEAIVPLAVYPSSSGGLNVAIVRGDYRYNGTRKTYGGTLAQDLTSNQPTSGNHRLVGLYLDSANTLQTVNGAAVASAATAADPTWPSGAMPLAVVDLDGDDTSFIFSDIANRREFNTYERLHNLVAATNPGVGDDDADGYEVGSIWINTTTPAAYICIDASTGAADWNQIDGSGGYPFDVLTVDAADADADHATIGAAITAASAGDVILVGPGTYSEQLTVSTQVTLRGVSQDDCIITNGSTPTVTISTPGVIIENLTINNTTASGHCIDTSTTSDTFTVRDCTLNKTGATSNIAIETDADAVIENCIIDTANATSTSAGVYINNTTAAVTVRGGEITTGTGSIVQSEIYLANSGVTASVQGPTFVNNRGLKGSGVSGWSGRYYDDDGNIINSPASSNWSTFTPTVTQSGSVTVTVNTANYKIVQGVCHMEVRLTVTGSGTAGNNIVIGNFPSDANIANNFAGLAPIGVGVILDNGTTLYTGQVQDNSSATSVILRDTSAYGIIGANPSFALANTDVIMFNCTYEVA